MASDHTHRSAHEETKQGSLLVNQTDKAGEEPLAGQARDAILASSPPRGLC